MDSVLFLIRTEDVDDFPMECLSNWPEYFGFSVTDLSLDDFSLTPDSNAGDHVILIFVLHIEDFAELYDDASASNKYYIYARNHSNFEPRINLRLDSNVYSFVEKEGAVHFAEHYGIKGQSR